MSDPRAKWHVRTSWVESDSFGKPTTMRIAGPNGCSSDDCDAGYTWTKFRMFDDDGVLYYEGEMNEFCDGLEPLTDFGMPNAGCTILKVRCVCGDCGHVSWKIV